MSFGSIADQYNRLRPSAPPDAIDWLLPDRATLVVDLAAGTGLLSRAIGAKAGQLLAVEPDTRMSTVLLAQSPSARAVAGVGEALPLRSGSVDAVLVSSAWHWMDPDLAVPEIGRVLRDGGRLGLIWTSRDRDVEWVRKLDLLREPADTPDPVEAVRAQGLRNRRVALPDRSPFINIETASFPFTRTIRVEDYAPMIATYSRIITASDEERAEILARVQAAVDEQFPGATEIELPMRSLCWRADRIAR
ncbi:MAG TPA: class I SAM-dependent methyltransferase [Streptosporangiaceae bacterium]|nr:class I SAM-dependent methyltransferase [Streptosporangiaceae bacterium]